VKINLSSILVAYSAELTQTVVCIAVP